MNETCGVNNVFPPDLWFGSDINMTREVICSLYSNVKLIADVIYI